MRPSGAAGVNFDAASELHSSSFDGLGPNSHVLGLKCTTAIGVPISHMITEKNNSQRGVYDPASDATAEAPRGTPIWRTTTHEQYQRRT
eukprot:12517720-Alexandrium_andersonii.AAC.1